MRRQMSIASQTGQKISDLTEKMESETLSEQEAQELLDLAIMRITNVTVAKSEMDWETVSERLHHASNIATRMAEDDGQ